MLVPSLSRYLTAGAVLAGVVLVAGCQPQNVAAPAPAGDGAMLVTEVVDGDTFHAEVQLPFGCMVRRTFRLRALNAPEAGTPAGRKAKRFMEEELGSVERVLLTSSLTDKYDRYLADVFYEGKEGERYLNRELLERGLASTWKPGWN